MRGRYLPSCKTLELPLTVSRLCSVFHHRKKQNPPNSTPKNTVNLKLSTLVDARRTVTDHLYRFGNSLISGVCRNLDDAHIQWRFHLSRSQIYRDLRQMLHTALCTSFSFFFSLSLSNFFFFFFVFFSSVSFLGYVCTLMVYRSNRFTLMILQQKQRNKSSRLFVPSDPRESVEGLYVADVSHRRLKTPLPY